MALNFPSSPSDQQTFTDVTTGVEYIYFAVPGVWKRMASQLSGTTQQFIARGTTNAFQLSANVANPQDILVTLNGILQFPPSHYSIVGNSSGNYLVFTSVPYSGEFIEVRTLLGSSTGTSSGIPSATTVSANNIVITGNITANGVPGSANYFLTSDGTVAYWAPGIIGPMGYTGSQGPQGYQGPAGGYTGSTGAGYTGSTGYQGSTGPTRGYSQINQPGVLTTTTGTNRWYAPANLTITGVVARVINAPQGSNTSININKDGQTVINVPILVGTTKSSNTININMVEDDYLTVDVASVGTTYPGSDLNVVIKYTYN
jgi:hypothetical protein